MAFTRLWPGAELATGEAPQEVGLAEAAGVQVGQDLQRQLAHRHLADAGRLLLDHVHVHFAGVGHAEETGICDHPQEAAAAFILGEPLDGVARRQLQPLGDDALPAQGGSLDIENEHGGRLHLIFEAALDGETHFCPRWSACGRRE